MTNRLALVLCPEEETFDTVNLKLLGLTVGERLLLALEKAGFTHVTHAGNGPRPQSRRSRLQIIDPESDPLPFEEFLLVPADLVFDPTLFHAEEERPKELPLRALDISALQDVARDPEGALFELGVGSTNTGPGFAIRTTDRENIKLADKALIRSLYKAADGVVSRYLNRRISTFISRRLAAWPITPNMITAVVFLVGVLSGPFAYLGTPTGIAIGGFCYWFSAVLDGCDGEISRLKYQGSPLGAWLDTVVDDLVCLSYIVGLYLALHRNDGGPLWYCLGGVAVFFFLLTILPRYFIMAVQSGSGDFQKMAKETRPENRGGISALFLLLRDVVFRTDFLPFAGMVTAVIGYPEVFAWPFALGAVASCIDTFATIFRYRKADAPGK